MTPVAIRRLLFVAALFCLPLPYALVEHGRVPAVWLVAVSGLIATAAVTQGGSMGPLLAKYLGLQAAGLVCICYVVAWLLTWVSLRVLPPTRRSAIVVLGVLGAAVAAFLGPIFRTTAVAGGQAVALFQLFAG